MASDARPWPYARQLALSFVILVLIVCLSGVSLWYMRISLPLESQARAQTDAAALAEEQVQQIELGHTLVMAYVQVTDPAARAFYFANIQATKQATDALRKQLAPLLPEQESDPLFQALEQARQA